MVTAEQVKSARELLGESQEEFGRRFGVDQSTIARWENRGPPLRGPGPMAIERVLSELGADQ
jgi:transcriptional regulator with XRE-family HTH domain